MARGGCLARLAPPLMRLDHVAGSKGGAKCLLIAGIRFSPDHPLSLSSWGDCAGPYQPGNETRSTWLVAVAVLVTLALCRRRSGAKASRKLPGWIALIAGVLGLVGIELLRRQIELDPDTAFTEWAPWIFPTFLTLGLVGLLTSIYAIAVKDRSWRTWIGMSDGCPDHRVLGTCRAHRGGRRLPVVTSNEVCRSSVAPPKRCLLRRCPATGPRGPQLAVPLVGAWGSGPGPRVAREVSPPTPSRTRGTDRSGRRLGADP